MKKIVMVAAAVHPVPPRKGAAVEWWMYQVCRRLAGFEPHIVSIAAEGYADEERRDGIAFHRIRTGRLYRRVFQKILGVDPYSYARRVARRLDVIRPDIVHVHNAPALFAELARRYRGPARWILHMHNEMPLERLPPGAVLFTVSRYLKEWYGVRLPGADIRIITNGVDTEVFHPLSATEVAPLRERLKLTTDKKIILYAGRVSPEKGPLDLLNAFREQLKQRQDVFLLLIGELRAWGPEGDRRADYGRRVLEICEVLGNHCYHAGVVNPANMHQYYPLADLVVVPSEFEEPFGMVAIEAMSCGTPVLATRRGGLPEIITNDVTGFLLDDAKDYAAFASRLNELLDGPARLEGVSRTARTYVEQRHDWNMVTQQLESLYDRLLERHPLNTPA
ncbi:MAG: glycosyltransferase [Pseudomonadota bacterium]